MPERLEAHYQNRIYYFYVVDINKDRTELRIEMYKTPYTFVKKDNKWVNNSLNKLDMIDPLIEIVVAAAGL